MRYIHFIHMFLSVLVDGKHDRSTFIADAIGRRWIFLNWGTWKRDVLTAM